MIAKTWIGKTWIAKTWIKRRIVADLRWIPLFVLAGMIVVFTGCGGSTTNVQNPPAPATTPIAIAFTPVPVVSLNLASTTTFTAVVSNDKSNAGVDWAVLCQSNTNCGTLTPLHTSSGATATYAPPTSIAGNTQAVTIEAFATADHSKNVTAPLTVTAFASNLKGNYVFQLQGEDENGPFSLAGVIVLDGNGGITSGEQTHSDSLVSVSDPITGGSYYVGTDGRGTITINTTDQSIGQQGVENLSLVFLSNSRALIATLDNPALPQPSFEISSGTLDLQTSQTAPSGGYAFAVNGTDINSQPMAIGGILKIDSPNTISGAGSVADLDDASSFFPNATISGTVTDSDPFGSLKFNLTPGFAPSLQFTGYIVDATHIKLIESDNQGSGIGFGAAVGMAIGQGSATGRFTGNSSFSGNYVFEILGQDLSGLPVTSLASIGQFSADPSGNLTSGYNDEFLSGLGVAISDSFTGTYAVDPNGTGRVDSSINFSRNGAGPELIFYLTGNGNPPLVLDVDVNLGAIGTGYAHPQTTAPFSFNGQYGVEYLQSSGVTENTGTGQVTVDGTSNTVSGIVDTNLNFSPQPNTSLSGTFAAIPSSGRSTGSLVNTFFPTPAGAPNTISVAYYVVDPSLVLFIETDSATSGELSFGYFAARSPVCPGCP